MKKYAFKVYLSGSNEKIITLEDMENAELFDIDRYVII